MIEARAILTQLQIEVASLKARVEYLETELKNNQAKTNLVYHWWDYSWGSWYNLLTKDSNQNQLQGKKEAVCDSPFALFCKEIWVFTICLWKKWMERIRRVEVYYEIQVTFGFIDIIVYASLSSSCCIWKFCYYYIWIKYRYGRL